MERRNRCENRSAGSNESTDSSQTALEPTGGGEWCLLEDLTPPPGQSKVGVDIDGNHILCFMILASGGATPRTAARYVASLAEMNAPVEEWRAICEAISEPVPEQTMLDIYDQRLDATHIDAWFASIDIDEFIRVHALSLTYASKCLAAALLKVMHTVILENHADVVAVIRMIGDRNLKARMAGWWGRTRNAITPSCGHAAAAAASTAESPTPGSGRAAINEEITVHDDDCLVWQPSWFAPLVRAVQLQNTWDSELICDIPMVMLDGPKALYTTTCVDSSPGLLIRAKDRYKTLVLAQMVRQMLQRVEDTTPQNLVVHLPLTCALIGNLLHRLIDNEKS